MLKIILTKTTQCLDQYVSFVLSVTSLLNFLEDISIFQASIIVLVISGNTPLLLVLTSPIDHALACNPGLCSPFHFKIALSNQGRLIWSKAILKEMLISFVFLSVIHLTFSMDSLMMTEINLLPPFFCLKNFWYFYCWAWSSDDSVTLIYRCSCNYTYIYNCNFTQLGQRLLVCTLFQERFWEAHVTSNAW